MSDRLTEKIRDQLDQSVEHLDGATLSRLTQARNQALDSARRSRHSAWWSVGGLATAAALVLAIAVTLRTPETVDTPPVTGFEDLELLATEDLDLVEDLDFYLWLEVELEENG